MAVVGRISGQLLRPNLLRDGVDLAFETDLLYLSVVDPAQPLKVVGIGVNTATPQYDLDVNGNFGTTNLLVDNELSIGNFTIGGAGYENSIRSTSDTISFEPSGNDPVIFAAKVQIDDIQLSGNVITTVNSNADLVFRANGAGQVQIENNARVVGNLNVTGNVIAGGDVVIAGNIVLGDNTTDTITINASIQSDLIPSADNTYDVGSPSFKWKNLYVNNLITTTLSISTLTVGDLIFQNNEITTTAGQDLSLDANGAGSVVIGNFAVSGNNITNISSGAISQLTQSGNGYFQIVGTNGFLIPIGTTAQRPDPLFYGVLPTGLTRYNIDTQSIEIWDGVAWNGPGGPTGAVSEVEANDIAATMALTLG